MPRDEINSYIEELRTIRDQVLADLGDVSPDEFRIVTDMARWDILRRVLLQIGNHMREHANQIEDTRRVLALHPSMAERMLADAELAYGKLLAALVGLDDADLDTKPAADEWSIREVLEHIVNTERHYLDKAKSGRVRGTQNPDAP